MKAKVTSGALFVIMSLVGCSASPSEPEALATLEQKIQKQSCGLIKLVSFQKTNRTEESFGGMKTYQLHYSAEIEFTDDCIWTGGSTDGWQRNFEAMRSEQRSRLDGSLHSPVGMQGAKKGQHQKVSGQVYFVKTENGWRLSD